MNQTVTVKYHVTDKFIVPKDIDLRNHEQVKRYWVKYNVLHIQMHDDSIIEVESQGWIHSYDYKHPANDIFFEEEHEE